MVPCSLKIVPWSVKVLNWVPDEGRRSVGRPRTRWSDALDQHFAKQYSLEGGAWMALAQDRATWKDMEEGFVEA